MSIVHKKRFIEKYQEPSTLDKLGYALISHINNHKKWNKIRRTDRNKVLGFCWELGARSIGASHYAPIGKNTKFWNPETYPAWTGRIWLRMRGSYDFGISELFEDSCTHLGTGGGGDYNSPWTAVYEKWWNLRRQLPRNKKPNYPEPRLYSWSFTVWQEDWPLIKKNFDQDHFMRKLAGVDTKRFKHNFLWQDPEREKLDKQWVNND